MAQIAQNRHLAAVFDELFSADGSTICLRPAVYYVRPGSEASFATVVAAARDRGECAIGYRRHDRRATLPDLGVRLNPHKGSGANGAPRTRWSSWRPSFYCSRRPLRTGHGRTPSRAAGSQAAAAVTGDELRRK